jgi:hypothetical protein
MISRSEVLGSKQPVYTVQASLAKDTESQSRMLWPQSALFPFRNTWG